MSDPKHDIVERAEQLPTRQVLHPAVEKILAQNPTPEALEKILALQRDWEAGEAKRAYTRALVGMRKDLPTWIQRDQKVDFQTTKGRVHYTHASLAAAMEAVIPALTAHGFSLSWIPATTERNVAVTAKLTHSDGHSDAATISAPADTGGLKSPAQAIASTITLLQRYTALSILGIATADMKDPNPMNSPKDSEDKTDSARNMRAMAAVTKAGKSKVDAENYIGRPVQQWTGKDLEYLRRWIAPAPESKPEKTPETEAKKETEKETKKEDKPAESSRVKIEGMILEIKKRTNADKTKEWHEIHVAPTEGTSTVVVVTDQMDSLAIAIDCHKMKTMATISAIKATKGATTFWTLTAICPMEDAKQNNIPF